MKYIHIGFPKCASTALQRHFFSKYPEIFHLGASSGGTQAAYINADMESAIEYSLRFQKDSIYDNVFIAEKFNKQFIKAEELNKKAVVISSESLSFTMHHDIDPWQKANRVHDIFGNNTKIIIVIRNQLLLLKSLYREYVLGGLHLTYAEFISSNFFNQGRSCLHDLNYNLLYEKYCQLFGEQNITIICYENLLANAKQSLFELQEQLNLSQSIQQLAFENKTSNEQHIETIRRLNCSVRLNHSRSVIEPIGSFRFSKYIQEQWGIEVSQQIKNDESFIKRFSENLHLKSLPYDTSEVDYSIDPKIEEKIKYIYRISNAKLAKTTQLDLDSLGYVN